MENNSTIKTRAVELALSMGGYSINSDPLSSRNHKSSIDTLVSNAQKIYDFITTDTTEKQ